MTKAGRKAYYRRWRAANPDYARKYYLKNRAHLIQKHRRWVAMHPGYYRKYQSKWQHEHPEVQKRWERKNSHKRRAYKTLRRAINKGLIPARITCEHCGNRTKLHKHHPDYSRPLLIVWLCHRCHIKEHRG